MIIRTGDYIVAKNDVGWVLGEGYFESIEPFDGTEGVWAWLRVYGADGHRYCIVFKCETDEIEVHVPINVKHWEIGWILEKIVKKLDEEKEKEKEAAKHQKMLYNLRPW